MTLEEKKLLYHARKESGLCVKCGKKDPRTESGRILCLTCLDKEDKYKARYAKSKKGKQALKKSRQACYNKRKALGLCTDCGKPLEPKRLGKIHCKTCALKRSNRSILDEKERQLKRAFKVVFSGYNEAVVLGERFKLVKNNKKTKRKQLTSKKI